MYDTDGAVDTISGRDVLFFNKRPAGYGDNLHDVIEHLCNMSNDFGYARFSAMEASECAVIIISGNMERFRTLAIAANLDHDCLAIQDSISPWFTGSVLCLGIDEIALVARVAFPNAKRWIIVGQSSGAYAALLLSRKLHNNITLAFAPQTFDDRFVKSDKIIFPPSFNIQLTSCGLHDVAHFFEVTSNLDCQSSVYIISSFSEHANSPDNFFWLDSLHWSRMMQFENVKLIVSPTTVHPPLLRNSKNYASAIGEMCANKLSIENMEKVLCDVVFSSHAAGSTP